MILLDIYFNPLHFPEKIHQMLFAMVDKNEKCYRRGRMEIRLLTAADAAVYRHLRLEGLQMNPEAFGSSFEEEKDMGLA